MLFSDPFFLFAFLPASLLLFYLVARFAGRTSALATIFGLSIIFYQPWGWENVVLLLTMLAVNFTAGAWLVAAPETRQTWRTRVLILAQIANFATLIWFKYKFVQKALPALGMGDSLSLVELAIPVGISFYTFHQAAFLVDAYRRDASVVAYVGHLRNLFDGVKAFLRFGAFVTFFPQLVIGPITYLSEFEPQTRKEAGFGRYLNSNIAVGLMLMAIGLFKKLVIADNLAVLADPVFATAGAGEPINAITGWIGVFAYYLQLYFDFSGYSDMALGIARLFGIVFPINFFSPLKSVGIIDFYRRWHMTLTRVISRFLFTPISLAATRFAAQRRMSRRTIRIISLWIPLVINFEVIGLWHGAVATFIVFGLIHGAWYILETEVRNAKRWKAWQKKTPEWVRTAMGRAIFLVPMALTFALFRSEDLKAAWHLLTQLGPMTLDVPRTGSALRGLAMIGAGFFVIYFLPNSVQLLRRWRPGLMTYSHPLEPAAGTPAYLAPLRMAWRPNVAWAVVWLVLVVSALYYVSRQPPFLYQGF